MGNPHRRLSMTDEAKPLKNCKQCYFGIRIDGKIKCLAGHRTHCDVKEEPLSHIKDPPGTKEEDKQWMRNHYPGGSTE